MTKKIKKRVIIILSLLVSLPLILTLLMFLLFEISGMEPRYTLMDERIDEIKNLIFCKKMLEQDNAWNPSINYNYNFYFKDGTCDPPEDLKHVKKIKKEFCDDPERKKHTSYNRAVREGICHR